MASNDVEIRVRVRNMVREGLAGAVRDARLAGGQAGGAFGDQFTRDANGRLHDSRGRYVSEGALAGQAYARGFGDSAGKGLKETFGKAFKDAGMAAALATNPIGGLVGSATALSGSLLLIPAAVVAAGAAFATLKIGMSGFSDALKSMDDPAKFAEALKKLSPEAAKTAVAFKQLSPQVKELKRAVQDGLFFEMNKEIKAAGNNLLPMLTDKLEATSFRLNDMGKSLTTFLSGPKAKNDLAVILKNTNTMLGNMKPVLSNIVSGFLSLGNAGSSFLPKFGTWLANITTSFKKWAQEANATGAAQDWIKNALDEFKELGGILKDLGSIVKTIWQAMGDASILQTIHGITSGVAEWLANNKELLPIVLNLLVAWKAFSAVKGILTGITGAIGALGGAAGRARTQSGGLLANLKGLKALGGLIAITVALDYASELPKLDTKQLEAQGAGAGESFWAGFQGALKGIGDSWDALWAGKAASWDPGKLFSWPGEDPLKLGDAMKKSLAGMDRTLLAWRTAVAPVSLKFEGDITPVKMGVANVVDFANGQTGTVTIGANGQPALVTVDGVRYTVDSTTGIMQLDGNQDPALDRLGGVKATIDKTTGRLVLDADDAPARKKIANLISTASQTIVMNVQATASLMPTFKASGGPARGLTLVGERGPELIRAMAGGGAAGGGMRLVGERGPELVNLGAGSSVLPYSNTAQTLNRMSGGQGGGSGGAVEVRFAGDLDSAFSTAFMRLVRQGKIQVKAA